MVRAACRKSADGCPRRADTDQSRSKQAESGRDRRDSPRSRRSGRAIDSAWNRSAARRRTARRHECAPARQFHHVRRLLRPSTLPAGTRAPRSCRPRYGRRDSERDRVAAFDNRMASADSLVMRPRWYAEFAETLFEAPRSAGRAAIRACGPIHIRSRRMLFRAGRNSASVWRHAGQPATDAGSS